jgi:hypothetical protein
MKRRIIQLTVLSAATCLIHAQLCGQDADHVGVRQGGFLRLGADKQTDTLAVSVNEPIRFQLFLPGGEHWSTANIGSFIIRTSSVQEMIDASDLPASSSIEKRFTETGDTLVALSAGPASEKGKSDSWERTTCCSKLFVRVGAKDVPAITAGRQGHAALTAKLGQRIELVPLIAPTSLQLGDDLPVRAFFDNGKMSDATVTAYRPDGRTDVRRTDKVGAAVFRIVAPGRWQIRLEHNDADTTYTAELLFDVLSIEPEAVEK